MVTPRAFAFLLAGRVLVRGGLSLLPLALRPAWSEAQFAAYTGAMTRFVFVVPLVSIGVEKSVLKLLPRAGRGSRELVAVYLGVLATIVSLLGLWIWVTAAGASTARLVALAGVAATLLGVNQVLVSLHRALRRPWLEVADQVAVFGVLCGGLVAAYRLDLSPEGMLATWVVSLGLLDAALVAPLLRPRAVRRPAHRLVASVARDVGLQGVTDVVTGASLTVLFALMQASGQAEELSRLYVVLSLSTVLTAGYTYLMRLVQPSVSLRLQSWREAPPQRLAPVWRPRTTVLFTGYSVAVLLTGRTMVVGEAEPAATWWLTGMLLAYVPVFVTVAGLHFVFENVDERSLRTTVFGAALGFLGVLATAVPLISWAGAAGALAAVVAGELVHLAVLVRAGRPSRRLPTAAPAAVP